MGVRKFYLFSLSYKMCYLLSVIEHMPELGILRLLNLIRKEKENTLKNYMLERYIL